MLLSEGYKQAVEIYNRYSNTEEGRAKVSWFNERGISKEYLTWAATMVSKYKIPFYKVLCIYKDWKKYVIPYYKKFNNQNPNLSNLSCKQANKIINECKRYWSKPNPLYNEHGVYVGEFKSFQDANMLPINTTWCVTHTPKRFEEFNNSQCKSLYIINNNNEDPCRRVIAVIYNDRIEYWDSNNIRMESNDSFENTLPKDVINLIHSIKPLGYQTENKLRNMIKESVRQVFKELYVGDNS